MAKIFITYKDGSKLKLSNKSKYSLLRTFNKFNKNTMQTATLQLYPKKDNITIDLLNESMEA